MKSVLNWLRSHSLKVLGAVLVVLAIVAVWLGQLPVDTASMFGVAGLGMLGVSVRLDQVHAVATAAAAAGSAYRAGDRAEAVKAFEPVLVDALQQPAVQATITDAQAKG